VALVRAKIQGFYDGKRIRPGEVFALNPEHPIGKWMELISEPEEEGLGPQIGVVAGQDTGPTVALEAETAGTNRHQGKSNQAGGRDP